MTPPRTPAAFLAAAETIVNSAPVIGVYAACEWDELGEDGKLWIAAIVGEAMARAANQFPSGRIEGTDAPARDDGRGVDTRTPIWCGVDLARSGSDVAAITIASSPEVAKPVTVPRRQSYIAIDRLLPEGVTLYVSRLAQQDVVVGLNRRSTQALINRLQRELDYQSGARARRPSSPHLWFDEKICDRTGRAL